MNSRDEHSQVMLSIAAVERDTGIGKDTLRVWERRYGFPVPDRDVHGERIYPMSQVEKLRVIKRLMDQGHRPGRIVAQPMEVLQHLSRGQANIRQHQELQTGAEREDLNNLIALIQMQDEEGLRSELQNNLLQEGVQRFVQDLVAPLTARVGEAWAHGDLAVHEEHLYTECVTRVLRQAIVTIPRPSESPGPRVLLTTFPQEEHGLGLLMVECLLTLQGCRCISLGTQTPLREIAQAAIAHSADVVALSFSVNMNANHVVDGLNELNLLLPASVEVWAGGGASALRRRAIDRVVVISELAALSEAVQAWRRRQPSSQAKNHDWT